MENLLEVITVKDIKHWLSYLKQNPVADIAVSGGCIVVFVYRLIEAIKKLKGDQNVDIEIIEEGCCEEAS